MFKVLYHYTLIVCQVINWLCYTSGCGTLSLGHVFIKVMDVLVGGWSWNNQFLLHVTIDNNNHL